MTFGELVVRPAAPEDAGEVRSLSIAFTPGARNVPREDFDSRYAAAVGGADWCIAVAQSGGRLLG
jgi:hypothetical protein